MMISPHSALLNLPVELWFHILLNISHGDLCNVALTSRHMNTLASLPQLWNGVKVSSSKWREHGLAAFYHINRFEKIKEINFVNWYLKDDEIERLLTEIPGSPLENAKLSPSIKVSAELYWDEEYSSSFTFSIFVHDIHIAILDVLFDIQLLNYETAN